MLPSPCAEYPWPPPPPGCIPSIEDPWPPPPGSIPTANLPAASRSWRRACIALLALAMPLGSAARMQSERGRGWTVETTDARKVGGDARRRRK